MLSRTHELLAKIGFAAAVTTNYDQLLERMSERWATNVLTLHSPLEAEDESFLLKLYGELTMPQTALLSHFEFETIIARSPVAEILRGVFETRTILFAGCSLEGLVADLNKVGVPDKIRRKHFALVGVSNASWQTQAAELERRYGIETVACSSETVASALTEFVEKLVAEVRKVRGNGLYERNILAANVRE